MSTPSTSTKTISHQARKAYFESQPLLNFVKTLDDDLALRKVFFHPLQTLMGGLGTKDSGNLAKTLSSTALILAPSTSSSDEYATLLAANPNPFQEFLTTHGRIRSQLETKHREVQRAIGRTVDRGRALGLIEGSVFLEMCVSGDHYQFALTEHPSNVCPSCAMKATSVEFLKVAPLFFKAWDNGVFLELWLYRLLTEAGFHVSPPLLVVAGTEQLAELDLVVQQPGRSTVVIQASASLPEPNKECQQAFGSGRLLGEGSRVCVVSAGPVSKACKEGFVGMVKVLDNAEAEPGFSETLVSAIDELQGPPSR